MSRIAPPSASSPRPPRKPTKGERTRAAIVDAALELAAREGLEGLTIGAVATRMRMSKSGVFAHFGSREDLQLAVLDVGKDRFIADVLVPALKQPRGLPRLRAIVANWIAWVHRYQSGCLLLSAVSEYDGREGALREAVLAQQAGWRDELKKTIAQAVQEGHLRADTDAAQLAFEVQALMLALHHDGGLFGHEEAGRHAAAAFERLWRSGQP